LLEFAALVEDLLQRQFLAFGVRINLAPQLSQILLALCVAGLNWFVLLEWSVKALFVLGHAVLNGLFCTLQFFKDLAVVDLLGVVELLGKVVLNAEDW